MKVLLVNMKRYLSIIKIEWQRQLTYRFEFFGWRFANFIEILVQLLIWSSLFQSSEAIRGYTYPEMLTYIVVGWMITFITSNYGYEEIISREIKDGTLSNLLIKPLPYIRYISARVIGRSWMAFVTGIVMQGILIAIFHRHILGPASIESVLVIIFMAILAFINRFLFSIIVGTCAFWTTETNGIFAAYRVLQNLLAGTYFPLDLLKPAFTQFFYLTPFIYAFFVPTQIYLGRMSATQGAQGILIQIAWAFFLMGIIYVLWKRGLKRYESTGI